MEGKWELVNAENHIWKYKNSSGNYGWIYVKNPYSTGKENYDWFHFDKDGIMTFGWYQADNGVWYYCHEVSDGNLGRMVKGWHEDSQDGKRYFLDKKTGIMLSGWQEIDGHSYYFATAADVPKQTWFWKALGDTGLGKWVYEYLGYKSFGSMYVNEQTPDGQKVNEAGMKE
jgi:glucan-binding YG repeat protein